MSATIGRFNRDGVNLEISANGQIFEIKDESRSLVDPLNRRIIEFLSRFKVPTSESFPLEGAVGIFLGRSRDRKLYPVRCVSRQDPVWIRLDSTNEVHNKEAAISAVTHFIAFETIGAE